MATVSTMKVFICYAREDETLRQGLEKQLRVLRRQGLITVWQDRDISPGAEWEREIDIHLSEAQLILLLVSPDFIDSDYCYGIEMEQALKKHERGETTVIPVILRHVYWQGTPFGKLQALPRDATPVMDRSWHNVDEAFFNVAEGIRKVVEDQAHKAEEEPVRKTHEEQANKGVRLDPKEALAYYTEGNSLLNLSRYEEALAAYDQAVRLDPNLINAYIGKGTALRALYWREESLAAYDQAIRLNPNDANAYFGKGMTLHDLGRYEESLAAYDQAIRLDPSLESPYHYKAKALRALGRSEEEEKALQAWDRVRRGW